MSRKGDALLMAGALALLSLVSVGATCQRGGEQAVPAEVEIEWPDAAVMPQRDARPSGDAARDAGP